MTVEQIELRKILTQMLADNGINRETIKDFVKEIIEEKIEKSIDTIISQTSTQTTDRAVRSRIDKYIDKELRINRIMFSGSIFDKHLFFIECPSCHWCGKTKLFAWRAKRAWNRRADK